MKESEEAHGGGMKKCKKQSKTKRMHLERCARSDQKRIKIIITKGRINLTRKIVIRPMRREAEQEINDLCDKPNNVQACEVFKKGRTRCKWWTMLKGRNGRLVFSEKDQKRVWKEHMKKKMNKENAWDQKTEIVIVEGPMEEVSLEEIIRAMKKIKLRKAFGLSV